MTTVTTKKTTKEKLTFATAWQDYYQKATDLLDKGYAGMDVLRILERPTSVYSDLQIAQAFCSPKNHQPLTETIDKLIHFYAKDIVLMTELTMCLNALVWEAYDKNLSDNEQDYYTSQYERVQEKIFQTFSPNGESTDEIRYFFKMTD